jgi:hypothetical protein
MWISSRTLNAIAQPRPARIAYLVPESPSHLLLDALVNESLSRWGGRRTPIIPTDGKSVEPAYWSFLGLWDADIIYSYVPLSEELESRIVHVFAPSEVRVHETKECQDMHDLRPDYRGNFQFLLSLSVLPLFARWSQAAGDQLPTLVDKEAGVSPERDLADSFGFASSGAYFGSLLSLARRIILKPQSNSETASHPREEVSYAENGEQLFEMIAKRRDVLTLSRLADVFCPHLRGLTCTRKASWDDFLTIVIGDHVNDRLLFWNAQHRYSALGSMDDIPVLRLSSERFQNGVPDWLRDWVTVRNRRPLGNTPRTVLRSCSLSKEDLDGIAAHLNRGLVTMVSAEHHLNPCVFDGCDEYLPRNRSQLPIDIQPTWVHPREARRASIRFENNELSLPLVLPQPIDNITASGLTGGVWAVDLCIERAEDHCPFSNMRDVWKWPRRLRLEQAIQFANYASSHVSPILPPRIRPTECGDLTVWDCVSWSRPTLHLPRDYQAFALAVEQWIPGSPEQRKAIETSGPRRRFETTVSDKGRDLLGVFQFFQSLPEALAFLTDDFWRTVIEHLSPEEPANNKKNIQILAQMIRNTVQEDGQDAVDPDRLAKRALALAARSLASRDKPATFETFLTWAQQAISQDRRDDAKRRMTTSVTYLRDRGFLWQGYGWRCSFCQHRNWAPLDRLSPVLTCEICQKPESSPVSGGLHFRLNPFVQHAFSSTSAQGPVIWCLDELAGRAIQSFAFTPSLDLYRPRQESPETDIDLLAAVDGQIYVVEVKTSFAGVETRVFEQLKLVAQGLKPDVVMLAVMDRETNDKKIGETSKELGDTLAASNVRFELLTLDTPKASGLRSMRQPFGVPMDKQMKWSAW